MKITACCGALLLAIPLFGFQTGTHAAMLVGNPPVTRFTPDLDVYPQNFAITEDRDAVIYVGNTNGVLVFDGGYWRLIKLPNRQEVRSLAYDGKSRIYVGGFNEFGYLVRDASGQLVFHDLTPGIRGRLHGQQFAEIWTVKVTSAGVLFQALQHLFLYNPTDGTVRLWRYTGRFGAIGMYHDRVFAQFRGQGFKYLDHGNWKMMPDGELLDRHVYAYTPLADGGMLLLATDGRWLEYNKGRVSRFAVQAGIPAANYFSDSLKLADGTLALPSVDGYLYLLSPEGQLLRRIHIDDGYLSGIAVDSDGGLLVIGDHAVIHVAWPSSWTVLGSAQGLAGSLNKVVRWNSHWYALTGFGVLENAGSANGLPDFKHLDWSIQEAWDLLPIDHDTALLADSYSLIEIRNGHTRRITHQHLYPRVLLRSRYDRNLVYVGTSWGIATLVYRHGEWKLRLDREDMQPLDPGSMIEIAPHTLWLGSQEGGVHLLKLSADNSKLLSDQRMGPEQGLDYGGDIADSAVFQLPDSRVVASTRAGEFLWQNGTFISYDMDGLNHLHPAGQTLMFANSRDGMWAYDYSHVYHRKPDAKTWQEEPIGRIRNGAAIQSLTVDAGGVLLVSDQSILCYRPVASYQDITPGHTMLSSVLLTRPDGTHLYLPLRAKNPIEIPQGGFTITFTFAMPDHAMQDAVRYQARLLGFEPSFSEWATDEQFTYSQLKATDYTFEVRGRDGDGAVTSAIPFSFIVVPKWYASEWARGIWIALLVLAGFAGAALIVRFRTRRFAQDKLLLERMVTERTAELETANRQLETMAHLDGLTGIANRRRLDDYLEKVWSQCAERQRDLSLLVIDVDYFKDYNDRHGHLAGDRLLKRLVGILSHCLRRTEDLLARYGGEEFLAVLPGADEHNAYELAEQMRKQVELTSLGATISVGIATGIPGPGQSVATLVNQADIALYQAKAGGRNRTAVSRIR